MVLVRFITSGPFDPATIPDSLKRGFYFSVEDWDVLASCSCNGQASKCDEKDVSKCICERNTAGHNCERCLPLFNNKPYAFRVACEEGLLKPNTLYYYCLDCGCNTTGTVNGSNVCNKVNGQCPCKPLLSGRTCNKCQDGYFGLTAQNPGCTACNCDRAGSVNKSCSSTGQCYCRPRFSGDKCHVIESGFYVPNVDSMTFQAEKALAVTPPEKTINEMSIVNNAGESIPVVAVKLNAGANNVTPTVLQFTVNVPKTGFYNFILRYKTNYNWEVIRIDALLRTTFVAFSCNNETRVERNDHYILSSPVAAEVDAHDFGKQCLSAGQYTVNLEIPYQNAQRSAAGARVRRADPDPEIFVDSAVVMPTVPEYQAFKEASPDVQKNMTFYYNASASLRTWSAVSDEGSAALSGVFGEIFEEGQSCNCSTVGSNNPEQCERNGGQCSCKMNVIGRTCDTCRPDYFNFTSGQGCTGETLLRESRLYVIRNSTRFRTFTFLRMICTFLLSSGCSPCECNPAGSMNLVCNKSTGECPCKVNSLDTKCNRCPPDFYGLEANHPKGCLKCQCSNKTSDCVTDAGWFISRIFTDLSVFVNNVDVDGWTGVNSAGSRVDVELNWPFPVKPFDKSSMKINTIGSEDVYFVAPRKYLGDKRFAYTFSLSFKLLLRNASVPVPSTKGDVILEGRWFDQPLVTSLSSPPSATNFSLHEVQFVESAWRLGNTSGRQPTSDEMIRVLSHLTSLRIRAKWTTSSPSTFLGDIVLTLSNRTSVIGNPVNASNVERCMCPPEYKGLFCEQCADGYTRSSPNGGPYSTCVPCHCNNHSHTCHPETGVCIDCSHNTTGDHCERCANGWYGNATRGTAADCRPCPCPGGPHAPNQFASTCFLDTDGLPTCQDCALGHSNRYCNVCSDGYFGRPWELGGRCRKCKCNNNTDPAVRRNCDIITGECINCMYNTTGFNCEWCAPEFHGNALDKTCSQTLILLPDLFAPLLCSISDCNCTSNQTVTNTTCDARGGQCQCITSPAGGRYGGRQCETCARYTVAIAENPLSCHACTEPCYRNWEGLIAIETDKVNKLSGNVTELLESFGTGLSVDGINQTLQLLNDNITYASQIFKSGGQADLKQKRDQINKIQESVESLQHRLNNSKSSIDDAMRYLQENVVNFNGSVHITPIMPVTYLSRPLVCPSQGGVTVIVDWECIEAMALIYRQRALQANASGHANYTSIQRSFIEIQRANATAHRAASMINASLSRLSEISELNNAVKIGDNFHSLNQNNSMKLREIAEIIAMLEKLLLDVEHYGNKTAMNLMKANETAILAKKEAGQRKREAESAFHNVSNAHDDIKDLYREAENVTNLAREFKENASRVLNSTEEAIRNVTDGVNTLGRVHNMTVEAVKISNEVRAMSMPVSLQQIQNLTEDILNTNVNQSAVNKTLESAQAGLKQAKEVEELSQRAM
ncbi:PREDICTED: laminin subunit gamma-1-like [Acropora digitifera]|uniref:laminin subunit gamma-1-like n=1 Tax=Acropora digitifera TaxID=70779 RepID=UPI00077A5739|nr:PREDICTED: laminin subunit gamma-1-like [Acropora digitifera]